MWNVAIVGAGWSGGRSLAEARDGVEVALPEADLSLVGPGARHAALRAGPAAAVAAGLRLRPGPAHATTDVVEPGQQIHC